MADRKRAEDRPVAGAETRHGVVTEVGDPDAGGVSEHGDGLATDRDSLERLAIAGANTRDGIVELRRHPERGSVEGEGFGAAPRAWHPAYVTKRRHLAPFGPETPHAAPPRPHLHNP